MKNIISKSNISKILGAGAILGLFLSMLIVSPVFPKTANAGWIDSNIFGGGTFFTDDVLGIDPEKDKNKTPGKCPGGNLLNLINLLQCFLPFLASVGRRLTHMFLLP